MVNINKVKKHLKIFTICRVWVVVFLVVGMSLAVGEKILGNIFEIINIATWFLFFVLILMVAIARANVIKAMGETFPKHAFLTVLNPLLLKPEERKRQDEIFKKAKKMAKS